MEMTREHYNQLKENFVNTRHLMSAEDCETMRAKLNAIRKELAFKATVKEWKEGKTVNCTDFIHICDALGVEISDGVRRWIVTDVIEVGQNSYSCVGKLHKTKEKTLLSLCIALTNKV